ncbi:MAG: chromosome segregation protein SMC [SAR202 cluster bacterium]|nr:chromosome segregation protein SMC [SAR202 cluster bacterium]
MPLHSMHIQGFKSIRDQELEFGPLNVFIGGNGAGKSNLISCFHLLNRIYRQELAIYTGQAGGANAILHFGRKRTEKLSIKVTFAEGLNQNIYELILIPTENNDFLIESEKSNFWDTENYPGRPYLFPEHWSGQKEAQLATSKGGISRYIQKYLDSYRIYHFHDTSPSAPPKQTCDVADNRFLRPDAANLAAFLYLLQEKKTDYYRNIEDTVRQIAPFFRGFKLVPTALNPDKIRLEWEEIGSDTYFNASALSDGTLRFICLATLLLQPDLPSVILIDEPELGLHPAAIQILAGLFQSASTRTQLLVATQSVTLINHLEPQHVWVVNREDGASVFKHLREADMASWLEDYSLGELWEKNVLTGRP